MEKTNLTILLTSRCTLKCKLCATYAPQNKKPCHYDSKIIMASVDKYFASMGDVCLFTLSGGEPLLHPDLVRMVQHFKQYASRMEKFEIITNGTIVPSEALLLALKEIPNVDVMIDDYGKNISKKVDDVVMAFEKYGIRYRRRKYYGEDAHAGGWLDISDFSDKGRTEEENTELFHKCMYTTTFSRHFFIIDGKAYMCYVNHRLLDDINEREDEHVDFCDENLQLSDIKEKLYSLRDRNHLSVCARCNGFCTDGKRYTPAEQLQ